MSKLKRGYQAICKEISINAKVSDNADKLHADIVGKRGKLTVWESENLHPGEQYICFKPEGGESELQTSCGEITTKNDMLTIRTQENKNVYSFLLLKPIQTTDNFLFLNILHPEAAMRYVFYKDNIYLITFGENCFVTAFKEKTDDTFYEYSEDPRLYARNINDGDIYDLYQLDFFVEYHGESYIIYGKRQTKKYKVMIYVEDPFSTEREPKGEYKTVDIHDCGKLWAHYIYFVCSGKRLDKEKAERVCADAEGFEILRDRHCRTKI